MVHDIDLFTVRSVGLGLGDCLAYLLPDANVSLSDEDTGVVYRLGQPELKHLKMRGS